MASVNCRFQSQERPKCFNSQNIQIRKSKKLGNLQKINKRDKRMEALKALVEMRRQTESATVQVSRCHRSDRRH